MDVKRSESSKPRNKRDLLVGAWWRLLVVSLLLPMIAGPTVRSISRLEGALSRLILRNVILCLAEALAISAAICAIIMIWKINSGQRAKYDQISQAKMSAAET
jgi:hypothetical protein